MKKTIAITLTLDKSKSPTPAVEPYVCPLTGVEVKPKGEGDVKVVGVEAEIKYEK